MSQAVLCVNSYCSVFFLFIIFIYLFICLCLSLLERSFAPLWLSISNHFQREIAIISPGMQSLICRDIFASWDNAFCLLCEWQRFNPASGFFGDCSHCLCLIFGGRGTVTVFSEQKSTVSAKIIRAGNEHHWSTGVSTDQGNQEQN